MPLCSDRCICLRRIEYSETSQILALFGRSFGLFRAMAKGAHRRTKAGSSKFDGGIDLLDVGDAVMTDPTTRELAQLTEWKLQDGHLELRRELRPIHLAMYCAELVGLMLHENDPHPELYDLLIWALAELPTDRREESFVAFQLELLRQSGFLPELGVCIQCGKPVTAGRIIFSPQQGGIICGRCPAPEGPRLVADAMLVRMLQTILRLPRAGGIPQRLPRLGRRQADPVNRLLMQYMQYTLGHELRVASYVL